MIRSAHSSLIALGLAATLGALISMPVYAQEPFDTTVTSYPADSGPPVADPTPWTTVAPEQGVVVSADGTPVAAPPAGAIGVPAYPSAPVYVTSPSPYSYCSYGYSPYCYPYAYAVPIGLAIGVGYYGGWARGWRGGGFHGGFRNGGFYNGFHGGPRGGFHSGPGGGFHGGFHGRR
ncbi:MAG: hypothetical protein LBV61_06400 [Burkholderiaceae bacterium]|nr:hypothetical protein [Burkholderiaceae bacterium]